MIYHVRAKLNEEHAPEFLRRLTDGSIARQRPDGAEIVASMKRAVVASDGTVEWSEMCFCPTPLLHERETVLDRHFDNIVTEPIEDYASHSGKPFMQYLEGKAAQDGY